MTQTRKKTERKLGTAAKTTTGSVVGLLDIKERRTTWRWCTARAGGGGIQGYSRRLAELAFETRHNMRKKCRDTSANGVFKLYLLHGEK